MAPIPHTRSPRPARPTPTLRDPLPPLGAEPTPEQRSALTTIGQLLGGLGGLMGRGRGPEGREGAPSVHDVPTGDGAGSGGPASDVRGGDEDPGSVHGGPLGVGARRPLWTLRALWTRLSFGAWLTPLPRTLVLAAPVLAALMGGGWWLANQRVGVASPSGVERRLVLTAGDLAARTPAFTVQPEHESFVKEESLLGDLSIVYRYEPPSEPDGEPTGGQPAAPQLAMTTRFLRSEAAALEVLRWTRVNTLLDWRLDGSVTLVELDEELSWGDESRAYQVQVDGRPVGYGFAGRMGRRTTYLVLRGTPCADGAEFAALLRPVLKRIGKYRP